ncbi:mRNA cleavage and polyadenylation specificity factor complex subunit [Niveomyces insectorum RCEF 264]|uniref:mRNA 3'-end-processing protein n=1 Tax=Niveomyces insectorum RCEF 264 TaxID=1081102 RepID=A0A167VJF9_9HYPO|nr:mRNA cleavage and polyadenylation specificity factor complex subunit [Niveomyces insectorum RCEF 264]
MATLTARPPGPPQGAPAPASSSSSSARLAADILNGTRPHYTFAFTPFLQTAYHHSLPPDRPICKAYSAGHCPLGARCPDRHVSSMSSGGGGRDGGGGGFTSLVCKHWLRGLCKKGEGCEFLHEYNLRKMPECNFFLRNGYCSNGDECLYLHIDPRSKLPPCPDYDRRGFCALGPRCPKKHVRRTLCPCYLAGFCPEGRTCTAGSHPKWSPVAVVAPAVAAEEAAAAAAAAEGGGTAAGEGEDGTTLHGDEDTLMGAADGDEHGFGRGGAYGPHHGDGGEDDRERPPGFRGGFNKDKFGGGGGRGGRWRGRGGGVHKFRGRGH